MDKICGRWPVKMLDWWLFRIKMPRWFWWWFYNVKIIWQNADGSIQGHNILWGIFVWGRFDVEVIDSRTWKFQYKHFYDLVTYRMLYGSCADGIHLIPQVDILEGLLYRKGKITAAFIMTRILPKKRSNHVANSNRSVIRSFDPGVSSSSYWDW